MLLKIKLKFLFLFFLFFPNISFAGNSNLILLCEGTEETVFYPIEKNIIDETVSKLVTVTYNFKNNLLLPNSVSVYNGKCDFRENTIYCHKQDNYGNYRLVSVDRISGRISDESSSPFEINGKKSMSRHFEGVCKTAKNKF